MNDALCKHKRMFAVVALRRFLCLLAMLGVVLGPVSAAAGTNAMAPSGPRMEVMAGLDVADDMSDCAEQQPVQKKDCGPACPLALLCSSTILAHEDTTDAWRVDIAARELSHGLLQERHLPSAILEPPARPPKA